MNFTQVVGNTWFLELTTGIPVYFLSPKQVILLDCGFFEQDGEMLRRFISDNEFHVRAVLVSHYHTDHVGNCLWLQEQGAEIIMPQWESVLGYSEYHRYLAYNPASVYDIKRMLPHMTVKADRVFPQNASCVDVCGQTFGVLQLPGHTYGHTGYVTPDNVCYVGDSLMTEKALSFAKLPSTIDWISDFNTKEFLASTHYDSYILAHKGVVKDIKALVQYNVDDKNNRVSTILNILKHHEQFTLNDAEQYLWSGLELHSTYPYKQTIYRRNVRCALEYLTESGQLRSTFKNGTVFYSVTSAD